MDWPLIQSNWLKTERAVLCPDFFNTFVPHNIQLNLYCLLPVMWTVLACALRNGDAAHMTLHCDVKEMLNLNKFSFVLNICL